ncbi:hypothetical protein CHLRE_03g170601v5 [Chlamydomonas reinhardtii]|uniref:Uncharacterized protein n=1 Tax=Chlamydomonas reinhardtii TaxID=3055 RepID=A0A2K3DX22_CHLRE|nr:uncharacterized protein CHLRE_03g170601v5 [Chlamydomonas reinhardtii]PNW85075.1 hypothetical protein CHLRE_03g170601v5 [Chlamydomonas reinhardtii]
MASWSLGAQISSLFGSLRPLRACAAAQPLASAADASTLAWRRADAPPSEEVYNRGRPPCGCGPSSPDGLHLKPRCMSAKGQGRLEARVTIASQYCAFPVSVEQAANASISTSASTSTSGIGAAMAWLRHHSDTATASVRPKGWEQLPGRAPPGRGLVKHRGRGSQRRPPEHSSLRRLVDQLHSDVVQLQDEQQRQKDEQQRQKQEVWAKMQQLQDEQQRQKDEQQRQKDELQRQKQEAEAKMQQLEDEQQRQKQEAEAKMQQLEDEQQRQKDEQQRQKDELQRQKQEAEAKMQQLEDEQQRQKDEQQRQKDELQRQKQEAEAKMQKFRAEVAPLQSQYTRNVVHQVAKFVLRPGRDVAKFVLTHPVPPGSQHELHYVPPGSQHELRNLVYDVARELRLQGRDLRPQRCTSSTQRKRSPDSTYADGATSAALAGVVEMSGGELEDGLKATAPLRHAGEHLGKHPGDLTALQRVVKDALQVCGERPTDPELAFARRLLLRYPAIEKAFPS